MNAPSTVSPRAEAIPGTWTCRERTLALPDDRPLVMGIVNVTPDSFSDGGSFVDPSAAIEHALKLAEDGADLIDIGGESTRPNADPVSPDEECRRIGPVLEGLCGRLDLPVSIDTRNAQTAKCALDRGAAIVNDVSAFTSDPAMAETVAPYRPGAVLMHMRGDPQTMQKDPAYRDVVEDVLAYLTKRLQALQTAGFAAEQLALDPGIGFGKTVAHNLDLLRGLPRLAALGRPILVGASRKSFIGGLLNDRPVDRRGAGSLGAALAAFERGAHILRVHDVKDTCDAIRLYAIIRSTGANR